MMCVYCISPHLTYWLIMKLHPKKCTFSANILHIFVHRIPICCNCTTANGSKLFDTYMPVFSTHHILFCISKCRF